MIPIKENILKRFLRRLGFFKISRKAIMSNLETIKSLQAQAICENSESKYMEVLARIELLIKEIEEK